MQNFRGLGAPPPDPQISPTPHCEFLATRFHHDDSRFSILAQSRFPFNLSALETTSIKTLSPALYRQKEFVYSLKIVH